MLLTFSIAPVRAGEFVTDAAADAAGRCVLPHRLDSMGSTVEGER